MEWIDYKIEPPIDDDQMILCVNWELVKYPMHLLMSKWGQIKRDKAFPHLSEKWTHWTKPEPPKTI